MVSQLVDPASARDSALHRLKRLRLQLVGLQARHHQCKYFTLINLVVALVVGVFAFLVCGVVVAAILIGLLRMDERSDAYAAALTLTALTSTILIVGLFLRFFVRRNRRRAAFFESQLRVVAEELAVDLAVDFPHLFRDGSELLDPALVDLAIATLERQPTLNAPTVPVGWHDQHRTHEPCAGQIVGGCRLVRKLGEGGMGAVYQGHHMGLDIAVAVKILRAEFAQAGQRPVERFLAEARAAAKLKHPNIVGVQNVGCEAGFHFIIMELVEGRTLNQILKDDRRLPIQRAINLVAQLCAGLQFAHDRGIIHRDIKPANIMVTDSGVVKIADLGLAKRVDTDLTITETGAMMGTPYYISPEQAVNAKDIDHRTDIYSLGCTFYQMVCGRVPYEGDTVARVLLAHAQSPVPDPRKANPSIPDYLASLIMHMMAKKPDERCQSAADVLTALSGNARSHRNE